MKYMENLSNETHWKTTFKSVGEQCLKEVTTKKDQIIKDFEKAPFSLKKDQCDPMGLYMLSCIVFESFKVKVSCY